MSAPSAERVAELAPYWKSVSIHEAGHAVVGVLLGVPVHHVRLDYQRVGFLRWEVVGWTAIGPRGRGADLDDRDAVLFTLAGLEAEALWISSTTGIDLDRARAKVQSRHANQGDVDQINACLPDSHITLDQAAAWVNATLHDQWQTVLYLAETLREHLVVSGTDVARLV